MNQTTSRQASLPENFEESTIDSMLTGETAYTVPWAMWVDKDRHCWLHPKYVVHPEEGGTAKMKVELCEDGYRVELPQDWKWSMQEHAGYSGSEGVEFIPVVELMTPKME